MGGGADDTAVGTSSGTSTSSSGTSSGTSTSSSSTTGGAVTVESTRWDDPRAVALRAEMDELMHELYSDRSDALPAGLTVRPDEVVATWVAVRDGEPVGHLAMRRLGGQLELKRLFVPARARRGGVARVLLTAAEVAARREGADRLVLHTGDRQPEAVALYERSGWRPIAIYPPYQSMRYSLCFEKPLSERAPA